MKNNALLIAQSVIAGLAIAYVVLLFMEPAENNMPVEFGQNSAQQIPEQEVEVTLNALKKGFAKAVKKTAPAVVYINTARVVNQFPAHPFLNDQLFREFLGSDGEQPQTRIETGLGSGVIVSPQGYILTNYHVIKDADQIQVQLADGRGAIAELVGADPETDLAVLQVALDQLPVINISQSADHQVGDLRYLSHGSSPFVVDALAVSIGVAVRETDRRLGDVAAGGCP